MRPNTEIWKTIPIVGLLLPTLTMGAVQFSCPQKGVITIWKVKTTTNGEILCVKRKFQFKGVIALPDPKQGEVYTLKCEKPKKEVK